MFIPFWIMFLGLVVLTIALVHMAWVAHHHPIHPRYNWYVLGSGAVGFLLFFVGGMSTP